MEATVLGAVGSHRSVLYSVAVADVPQAGATRASVVSLRPAVVG